MPFAVTGMCGGIYGVNGRFLEIKDLTSCFKAVRCPSLAGKPKLFFLQACQGRAKQQGKDVIYVDQLTKHFSLLTTFVNTSCKVSNMIGWEQF